MSGSKKTRKRKNAGAGYGYMFHGAFAEKKDAVAKERKTKGAFVKPVMMRSGMRYAVMSPRTNPPKRNPGRTIVMGDRGLGQFTATRRDKQLGQVSANGFTKKEALTNLRDRIRSLKESRRNSRGNPSELVVMAANPHENAHEIQLPPGSTITIRTNPTNPAERYTSQHAIARGLSRHAPGLIQSKRQRRVAKMVRTARKHKYDWIDNLGPGGLAPGMNPAICGARIGGEICTRKPGHRGPHLPQGATLRTKTRLRHSWKPRANPSAAALRESFTGKEVDYMTIYKEPHMEAGNYAQLGRLLALYVKPNSGGQVQKIEFRGADRPVLVSDETAHQMYFVGGNQDLGTGLEVFAPIERGNGVYKIGEARRIDYQQRKEHVSDPDADQWRHAFGEESGVHPAVLFDRINKRLLLEGGEYRIESRGIIN